MNKVSLLLVITAILSMLAANFSFSAEPSPVVRLHGKNREKHQKKVLKAGPLKSTQAHMALQAALADIPKTVANTETSSQSPEGDPKPEAFTAAALPEADSTNYMDYIKNQDFAGLHAWLQKMHPELSFQECKVLMENLIKVSVPFSAADAPAQSAFKPFKHQESDNKTAQLEGKDSAQRKLEHELLALVAACDREKAWRINQLIKECKVNIDACDDDGNTALMLAAKTGKDDMLHVLIPHKPNFLLKNKAGMDAYAIAVRGKNTAIDEYAKAGYTILENCLLDMELQYGRVMHAKQNRIDNKRPTDRNDLLEKIRSCALVGDAQTMLFLIGQDDDLLKDMDSNGNSLLMLAALTGNTEILECLWERDTNCAYLDPFKRSPANFTARQTAERFNYSDAIQFLRTAEKEQYEMLVDQKSEEDEKRAEAAQIKAKQKADAVRLADKNMRALLQELDQQNGQKAPSPTKTPSPTDKNLAKNKKYKARKAKAKNAKKQRISPLSATISPRQSPETNQAAEERRKKAQETQLQKQREYDAGLAAVEARLKKEHEKELEEQELARKTTVFAQQMKERGVTPVQFNGRYGYKKQPIAVKRKMSDDFSAIAAMSDEENAKAYESFKELNKQQQQRIAAQALAEQSRRLALAQAAHMRQDGEAYERSIQWTRQQNIQDLQNRAYESTMQPIRAAARPIVETLSSYKGELDLQFAHMRRVEQQRRQEREKARLQEAQRKAFKKPCETISESQQTPKRVTPERELLPEVAAIHAEYQEDLRKKAEQEEMHLRAQEEALLNETMLQENPAVEERHAQALNFTAFHRPASDGTYRLF